VILRYADLLALAGPWPVFESASLRALGEDPRTVGVQLSRWVSAGKLVQLRRGKYLLPAALRRSPAPLETIANLLVSPSYVSLERALSLHSLIPEAVPVVQSVTSGRPGRFVTPAGIFEYRHVKPTWFFGYRELAIGQGSALVATPEKALLDLFYLSTGAITPSRLAQYRFQELAQLDCDGLRAMAAKAKSPRLERAAKRLCEMSSVEGDWEKVGA